MLRVAPALAVVLLAASCGGDDDGASVSIASPEDGATVASTVEVTMEAEGFTIERVGGVRDGAGHFHLVTKTAAGFRFPVLEPLFAQGSVALVGPERAEGRALHVVAGTTRYVTEWTLRCTSCG